MQSVKLFKIKKKANEGCRMTNKLWVIFINVCEATEPQQQQIELSGRLVVCLNL